MSAAEPTAWRFQRAARAIEEHLRQAAVEVVLIRRRSASAHLNRARFELDRLTAEYDLSRRYRCGICHMRGHTAPKCQAKVARAG